MTDAFLASAIATMSKIAEMHEHALDVKLGPPGSEADISEVERYVGGSLPPSLKRLLQWHNGIRLCFDDKRAVGDLLFPYGTLELYGTADIIDNTLSLREWLGDIDFSKYDACVKRKAYSCVDIASVSACSSDLRVVISPHDVLPNGEYVVAEVDLEIGIWLSAIGVDIQSITIDRSCEAFIERSIDNVMLGRQTFRYWDTKAAWQKYSLLQREQMG